MGYIIVMILLAAVCAAGFFALPPILNANLDDPMRNEAARQRAINTRTMVVRGVFLGIFVVLGGLFTVYRSVKIVEAGHVGLVYRFGDIVGQRDAGLALIWPWETFKTADIRIQAVRAETDCDNGRFPECIESFSSETQDVFVQATLNISVNPDDVQTLYRTVGSDYLEKVVRPRLLQTFKDQTVQYRSIDIAPNREEIRVAVRDAMSDELARFSITVNDLLVDNIDFREEFKQSIEAKQIASQEALRQQELVAAREAEARQRAAEALGNADKLRIEAQGQSDANRLINESLTPLLIQFQALQKLSDNVSIALIPSGEGLIIDPATLLGQQPATP